MGRVDISFRRVDREAIELKEDLLQDCQGGIRWGWLEEEIRLDAECSDNSRDKARLVVQLMFNDQFDTWRLDTYIYGESVHFFDPCCD